MDKVVSISKEQYIASLNLAAYMAGKFENLVPLKDILEGFSKVTSSRLKEDWNVEITLKDYENFEFSGDDDEK